MTVTRTDINAIHTRLNEMAGSLSAIAATCPGCRESVKENRADIQGLKTDIAVMKSQKINSGPSQSGKFAVWLPSAAKPYLIAGSILAGLLSAFFGGTLAGFFEERQSELPPPSTAPTQLDHSDSGG